MSDLQIVVNGAKTIEKVLVDELGGSGRGLYETMSSSRTPIPQALQRRIRYVATLRNKNVHELRFDLGDAAAFTERCARIVEDLRQLHAERQLIRTVDVATSTSMSIKPWIWGAGAVVVLALLVGGYVMLGPDGGQTQTSYVETTTRSAPLTQGDQKSVPAPDTSAAANRATPAAAVAGADAGAGSGGDAATGTSTAGTTTTSTPPPGKTATSDGYYGVAKDAVSIESASLAYQADASGRHVPVIEVSVRNASTSTLQHALLDARVYINGDVEPVLLNGKRRSANEGPLYAHFGATGLAVGETRKIRLYAATGSDWSLPEILKARSRRLVVQTAEGVDGSKNKAGVLPPVIEKPTVVKPRQTP